jgi:hypothetical protein
LWVLLAHLLFKATSVPRSNATPGLVRVAQRHSTGNRVPSQDHLPTSSAQVLAPEILFSRRRDSLELANRPLQPAGNRLVSLVGFSSGWRPPGAAVSGFAVLCYC